MMDWKPAGPAFFDDDGLFLSPAHAATHAIIVQGGFTDPWREADRMIADGERGGTLVPLKERAEAWLTENPRPQ